MRRFFLLGIAGMAALTLLSFRFPSVVWAMDADAALALAKKNDCMKCHAIDKEKKGPSYRKIAEKFKGKPSAEADIMKNITTGPKVKFSDGTEEEHKIINTKDPAAIKNLIAWILAQ